MQSWYWDLNDDTRAWAKRFFERTKRMPNDNQAKLYSSVLHYLEAVKKTGGDDALAIAKAMKEAADPRCLHRQRKSARGRRVVYDRYLVKVKQPTASNYPWDYLSVIAKIPADEAFRPLGSTGCSLSARP